MIQVSQSEFEVIINILKNYVPNYEVWAFGSRYKKIANEYSDLDLVIVGQSELTLNQMPDLKYAFQNRVDILDWNILSDEFKSIINNGYEVIYSPV
ncbi:nucleotidyltransferase family protein [Methanobrevibacter filiformis]|uniref:protein adenylyltransferase n=1 Tax=Methanobrevibacter filiformis TaxID=55758 RepID=A0A166DC17_9EURY|nr:nucleotidyltransferase domain-containing protein [Methanobrevibacter filiformis]KZX15429.1 nucleotidyltransferase domain protein [Methanobrevibacter filiformis]